MNSSESSSGFQADSRSLKETFLGAMDIPSITEHPTWPQGSGQFFFAVDIARFLPLEDFKARMDRLIDAVAACERVDPDQPILLPGQREYETAKRRTAEGIPIPPNVLDDLKRTAADCAVPWIAD